jgi:hypothetical protein
MTCGYASPRRWESTPHIERRDRGAAVKNYRLFRCLAGAFASKALAYLSRGMRAISFGVTHATRCLRAAVSGWNAANIDLIKAAPSDPKAPRYLPVSSTGHLLFEHVFGWATTPSAVVCRADQLGAILALLSIYFGRLLALAKDMFTSHRRALSSAYCSPSCRQR